MPHAQQTGQRRKTVTARSDEVGAVAAGAAAMPTVIAARAPAPLGGSG
jgi:hypothetical protein